MPQPPQYPPDEMALIVQALESLSKLQQHSEDNAELARQRNELFAAIGEAITEWATVEHWITTLFVYFTTATVSPDERAMPALSAFSAVINFNAKLSMVYQAALRAMPEERLVEWKTLHNAIGRQAKHRNDVVHFVMTMEYNIERDETRVFLTPSAYFVTPQQLRPKSPPRLNLDDVRQRTNQFRALAAKLADFAESLDVVAATPAEQLRRFAAQLIQQHRLNTGKAQSLTRKSRRRRPEPSRE